MENAVSMLKSPDRNDLDPYIRHYDVAIDLSSKLHRSKLKISHLLSPKILTNLYNTLIDPYLTYGNIVWASNYESRIGCLTLLQKKMIRIVAGDSFNAHTETRYLELRIIKFENINTYLMAYLFINPFVTFYHPLSRIISLTFGLPRGGVVPTPLRFFRCLAFCIWDRIFTF